MDNDIKSSVICQCLNGLGISGYRSVFLDHRSRKLTTGTAIELHVVAQLLQLGSYDLLTEQLKARPELQAAVGLDTISNSSLTRKLKVICTESLQNLFLGLVQQIQALTADQKAASPNIGRLHLVDATDISLPTLLGRWARCGERKTGVRLHVRLVAVSPDALYPDKVIASTSSVREAVVACELVTDENATYVMDRGYEKHKDLEAWLQQEKKFVVRIRDRTKPVPMEETRRATLPSEGNVTILEDVDVQLTKIAGRLRLVAFMDRKGRTYRVLTNRWDVTAAEVAQIYKSRWLIELFFKWVKQHLNLVRLYSKDPEAVWNQLFLSLIAYAVSLLVKLRLGTTKTQWAVLKLLRTYWYDSWEKFLAALNRKPKVFSKGRQKVEGKKKPPPTPQRIILR